MTSFSPLSLNKTNIKVLRLTRCLKMTAATSDELFPGIRIVSAPADSEIVLVRNSLPFRLSGFRTEFKIPAKI
jgi:hypothetical protein